MITTHSNPNDRSSSTPSPAPVAAGGGTDVGPATGGAPAPWFAPQLKILVPAIAGATLTQITEAIVECNNKLALATSLNPTLKAQLNTVRIGYNPEVTRAALACLASAPALVPAGIDLATFEREFTECENLQQVSTLATDLQIGLTDTLLIRQAMLAQMTGTVVDSVMTTVKDELASGDVETVALKASAGLRRQIVTQQTRSANVQKGKVKAHGKGAAGVVDLQAQNTELLTQMAVLKERVTELEQERYGDPTATPVVGKPAPAPAPAKAKNATKAPPHATTSALSKASRRGQTR